MKRAIMWILTGFMGLSAIVFFPSVASVIMLAFAVMAAPIESWQELLSGWGLRGWLKGLVLCAVFLASVMTVPTDRANRTADRFAPTSAEPSYYGTLPSKKPDTDTAQRPEKTQQPSVEPSPGPTATPQPTPEPTVKPTPEPSTPAPAGEPAQDPSPLPSGSVVTGGNRGDGGNFQTWDNPDQQQTTQTWVLNTNTMKIHYPSCSSVARIAPHNYATSSASLEELLGRGYSRCGRCF